MKKRIVMLSVAVMLVMGGASSQAATFDLSAGVGMLRGDTTYQIGYPVDYINFGRYEGYFPFSELEFPLDVTLLDIAGSVEFMEMFTVGLEFKTNITDDAGDMKDSDWLTQSNPGRLDVYSTSDAELTAMIVDFHFGYTFYKTPNWKFTGGTGYLHQNFDFDTRLKRQYSPSGLSGYDVVGDGSVTITYDITYRIPYLDMAVRYSTAKDRFVLDSSFGYAPVVSVTDTDKHLLRNKVNKGDLEGSAIMLSLAGRYYVFKNWYVSLGFDYLNIVTDRGDMDARFSDSQRIYDHTVTEEVESSQVSVLFKVGYGSIR